MHWIFSNYKRYLFWNHSTLEMISKIWASFSSLCLHPARVLDFLCHWRDGSWHILIEMCKKTWYLIQDQSLGVFEICNYWWKVTHILFVLWSSFISHRGFSLSTWHWLHSAESFRTTRHDNLCISKKFICLWALHPGELQKPPVTDAKETY